MAPPPINTERGSIVAKNKRQHKQQFESLFHDKIKSPSLSLRHLSSLYKLDRASVAKRWKAYEDARRMGKSEDDAIDEAATNRRGGYNRALSIENELILKSIVLASSPSMTQSQISTTALQFRSSLESNIHQTRHHTKEKFHRPFVASPRFITGFKRRQRLSSHRTAIKYMTKEKKERNIDEEKSNFVTSVHTALVNYSPELVLNMDETPVSMIDAPITGIVATGCKTAAIINTTSNPKLNITTFPTITASGHHLPLCAIIKGDTIRCTNKITNGASDIVNKVKLYWSHKGWMNADIMALWLWHVVHPYTRGRPCAIILDSYPAHWTDSVKLMASLIKAELIQVPRCFTSTLQPLDVSFNGPMLKARQKIWREMREKDPWEKDTQQKAIERAQLSYQSISSAATIDAFRKSQLLMSDD